jgi:hypothetical protein
MRSLRRVRKVWRGPVIRRPQRGSCRVWLDGAEQHKILAIEIRGDGDAVVGQRNHKPFSGGGCQSGEQDENGEGEAAHHSPPT